MNWRSVLTVIVSLVLLAILSEAGTVWVCWHRYWTPLQRHYMPVYLWCSLPVIEPATADARLIWKSGKHKKRELATDGDVIDAEDGSGLALSPLTRDAGWTQLSEDLPVSVSTVRLKPALADLAFNGEDLDEFLLLPEMCAGAVFVFLVFTWFFLRSAIPELIAEWRWRRRPAAPVEPDIDLFERLAAVVQTVGGWMISLHRAAQRRRRPQRTAPAATTTQIEPPVRPSFAFPIFGVYNEAIKGTYLWSEKDEID